jgi:hypothetical protein
LNQKSGCATPAFLIQLAGLGRRVKPTSQDATKIRGINYNMAIKGSIATGTSVASAEPVAVLAAMSWLPVIFVMLILSIRRKKIIKTKDAV